MKKLRLKRIAMLVGAITCMISAIFTISYKNKHNTNQKNENNIPIKLANRESRDEIIKVADNALNVQKEERNAILQEMYEDIPDKKIKEYEDMPIEELKEDIDNLEEKYQVGQIFSKEDQNKVLFAYEKYGGMRTKNYTSLLPCYIKTWGTLIVKCDAGEFDLKTGIKSSWE